VAAMAVVEVAVPAVPVAMAAAIVAKLQIL